jgi:hypothetical protein
MEAQVSTTVVTVDSAGAAVDDDAVEASGFNCGYILLCFSGAHGNKVASVAGTGEVDRAGNDSGVALGTLGTCP